VKKNVKVQMLSNGNNELEERKRKRKKYMREKGEKKTNSS